MPCLDRVNGVMQSWYLGSEAGHATAAVICGEVNPSGKLPFSIPRRLEDNGAHHFGEMSYPGDGTAVVYRDDILVGYRCLLFARYPAYDRGGSGEINEYKYN